MTAGIRELKDNLSRYIRRIEAGESISITVHGGVVAELVPAATSSKLGTRESIRRARHGMNFRFALVSRRAVG